MPKGDSTYLQTRLPMDGNGRPVQVIVGVGGRANATAASTTSNAALPATATDFVAVRCTDWIWLNFGTAGVTAAADTTSALVPPGEGVYELPAGATHFAVLRAAGVDAAVQLEAV